MKKIALFLMAAFAVIACEEEFVPHLDFLPTEVTIPTAGTDNLAEPLTFNFTANAAWTAAVDGENVIEWLSISPKQGQAGEAAIKFTATANTAKENRTATLVITVEGLEPIQVPVVQLQKNAIDVNAENAYTISFKGGSAEIEVGYNVDYTYEVVYGKDVEPWLAETKAYATDKLTFTAPEQVVNAPIRTATLYVYSELGVVKAITITQEAWSPVRWSNSLTEMGATAGRAGIGATGDKVYFTVGGELWVADEATGENAQKVALPDGFVAGGVHVDDAGNLMVSGPDRVVSDGTCGQLQLYKVAADGAYTALVDYNSANYWCTEMGNFRVKGDINGDALIMAYICVGTGHYVAWEVKGGVVGEPKYGDLHDGSWDASTGVVAPAGASLADGFFAITYGSTYNLNYFNGEAWSEVYVTGSTWMENYNCISTTEVNGKKYLAMTASCHFDYDYTDIIVVDVTDVTAVKEVFKIQMNFHAVNAGGLTYSDIFIKGEGGNLAAYVVDPWMDTVEKYLFPLE
ncbi:MAG: BACON domain-containing protein [Bacteroidales bacterium]|nr:BACON domain-containing protein [Bacteroidales bacterium]